MERQSRAEDDNLKSSWPGGEEIARILISGAEIQERVRELGAAISRDYAGLEPRLIGILKGVVPFMADLMRAISIPVSTDFMAILKYDQLAEGKPAARLIKDLDSSITGKHVLLVEDIIDMGITMQYVLQLLEGRQPASLKVCTLFSKPPHRVVDLALDYIGFDLPDVFVVGYGLDYEQKYRNLPYLAVLKPEVYTN